MLQVRETFRPGAAVKAIVEAKITPHTISFFISSPYERQALALLVVLGADFVFWELSTVDLVQSHNINHPAD